MYVEFGDLRLNYQDHILRPSNCGVMVWDCARVYGVSGFLVGAVAES